MTNATANRGRSEKKQYLVELRGNYREVYAVEAESAEEARQRWMRGVIVSSEVVGPPASVSVREDGD